MSQEPVVLIVAGEPSGDIHAARLMVALKQRIPGIRFVGIGGERMIEQGLDSIVDIRTMSVVGFWEVAKRYTFFKRVLADAHTLIASQKPSVFIPVDYPGFNMRLAAHAKKSGVPVVWYIAPQLWAWGEHRARGLADVTDELLVVFPFEQKFFAGYGIQTTFIGHPLLDDETFGDSTPLLEGRSRTIAFLPGSRTQEVQRHLPIMAQAADIVRSSIGDIECSIATSPLVPPEMYDRIADTHGLTQSPASRTLMKQAMAGVVKTGTSTLEAALCGMPFAMMYRTSRLSYMIARSLITLDSISLVNILAGCAVIPELIQYDATPQRIAHELQALIEDESKRREQHEQFCRIRTLLGDKGASGRAADSILRFLR
ncbi:MAG: lipid-A-disaccharide synthase [Candidatus Kapabacteria bacterium]|nr:lipid-A-disaccharide synthase [Candidatus Kapabacteria bacterium]